MIDLDFNFVLHVFLYIVGLEKRLLKKGVVEHVTKDVTRNIMSQAF
jgi:hypothetical protein